jgi:hypothetical protein
MKWNFTLIMLTDDQNTHTENRIPYWKKPSYSCNLKNNKQTTGRIL